MDMPETRKEFIICAAFLLLIAVVAAAFISGIGAEIEKDLLEFKYKHEMKQYRKEVTIYNDDDKCAYLTPNSDYFYAVGYLYEDEILGVVIRDTMEILQYSGVPYDKFVSLYYDNAEEWMQEYYEYDIADIYECENLGVLQP